jgi:hypothetical protein
MIEIILTVIFWTGIVVTVACLFSGMIGPALGILLLDWILFRPSTIVELY